MIVCVNGWHFDTAIDDQYQLDRAHFTDIKCAYQQIDPRTWEKCWMMVSPAPLDEPPTLEEWVEFREVLKRMFGEE